MKRKVLFFTLAICIALAVVVTEDIAAYELAHHEYTGEEEDSAVSQRAKAAAEFLDTLKLASLFLAFIIFLLFLIENSAQFKELIFCPGSLISLKVRNNS